MNGSEPPDVEALFERALISEDEAYQMAETRLREAADSEATLQQNLDHSDPVGQLMARVMLEWSEAGGDDFAKADEYLRRIERRFEGTVVGAPPPRGVVHNLSARFGGRLAEFLALRLTKESKPPSWRVLATLGYLEQHRNPATTEALIRFAAKTPVPQFQQRAAQVLAAIGDPELPRKLVAERERLAREGRQLPPVLAALSTSAGAVA